MTIATYAVTDNLLPPPVSEGATSTTHAFTDVMGETWVAQYGVNNGTWNKARDVLNSHAYRVAALPSSSTSQTAYPFDTVSVDTYGMWTPASYGWTVPVAGWYRLYAFFGFTSVAIGNYASCRHFDGSQQLSGDNCIWTVAGTGFVTGQIMSLGQAGDLYTVQYYTNVVLAGAVGSTQTRFSINYVGPG